MTSTPESTNAAQEEVAVKPLSAVPGLNLLGNEEASGSCCGGSSCGA